MTVGKARLDSDLINGFVRQRQGLTCQTYARGEDVGGRCLAGVLAEAADEPLDAHASAFGEEVVRQLRVRRTGDEREDLRKSLGERLRGRIELCKDDVQQRGGEMEQTMAVSAALMGVDELHEQAAHGVFDRKKHGIDRKRHTGSVGGEVQPVVTGAHGADAVENGVGGDQDGVFRLQRDLAALEDDMAAWLGIVIEAPEGRIDALMVPILQRGLVAAFMDQERRPTGRGDTRKINTPRCCVVKVFAPIRHNQTQVRLKRACSSSVNSSDANPFIHYSCQCRSSC